MKKIVLINCYFGKFPDFIRLFLQSCADNPTVDFLFFTDNIIDFKARNIKFVKTTFAELKERIQSHFDFDIRLEKPYKLCDYKPAYGLVFQEYLQGYDFWGYCDVDLVFGDIRNFITDDILSTFDKIYQLGHLTLYRNAETINTLFMSRNGADYKKAFTTDIIDVFDEADGVQKIFANEKKSVYISRDYADITKMRYRFTLSDFLVDKRNNNYPHQVFVREKGHVYRYYIDDSGIICRDEFIYIHFQKRKMSHLCSPDVDYYVTYDGFFELIDGVSVDSIKSYNKYILGLEVKNKINHFLWRAKRKLFKFKEGKKG